jgi:hypothetical protein
MQNIKVRFNANPDQGQTHRTVASVGRPNFLPRPLPFGPWTGIPFALPFGHGAKGTIMGDSDTRLFVLCGRHGKQRMAIVCNHLLTGRGLGFCETGGEAAWCDECDRVYFEVGGDWDQFDKFAYLRSVCVFCFEKIRKRNRHRRQKKE